METETRDFKEEGKSEVDLDYIQQALKSVGVLELASEDRELDEDRYILNYGNLESTVNSGSDDGEEEQWDIDEYMDGMNEKLQEIGAYAWYEEDDIWIAQPLSEYYDRHPEERKLFLENLSEEFGLEDGEDGANLGSAEQYATLLAMENGLEELNEILCHDGLRLEECIDQMILSRRADDQE
jgi:hypothetical protein